ncbi:VOC family protein [Saccharopolyspora sp. CA-218241]|uniref:VOC family protein n=1 Tax=Saccharopolyspora sp. CA-218241 TaxID=3240027 RepID=UPI003D9842F2
MLPSPARGLRRAELLTADPLASVLRYQDLLGWVPVASDDGALDCWVGERRCASVRTPRTGEPNGWRPVFAGAAHDGSLTGPEDAIALVVRGRAQHGPHAPRPRPGEPCWVELATADPGRADAFWAETLNWAVRAESPGADYPGADYLVDDRPLAGRSDGAAGAGWLCYFAVADLAGAQDRAVEVGASARRRAHPVLGEVLLVTDSLDGTIGLAAVERWGGSAAR